jgi:hypothetical protein
MRIKKVDRERRGRVERERERESRGEREGKTLSM